MPANHSRMRLGKKAVKHDMRTLMLASYLDLAKLPPPPPEVCYSKAVRVPGYDDAPFGMLKNDEIGDCTIAGALHLEQVWSANAGNPLQVTEADAIEGYQRICGYDPKDPESDQGGVELDVLNAWRKVGIGSGPEGAHRQIVAFVKLDATNELQVKTAISVFGGIYTGFNLPASAQTQDVWTPVRGSRGKPGSWGGHAIPFVDYTADGKFVCITWGALKRVTWQFFRTYCDEAYAVVSNDFLNAEGKTPAGLNLAALQKDLRSITQVRSGARVAAPSKAAAPKRETSKTESKP